MKKTGTTLLIALALIFVPGPFCLRPGEIPAHGRAGWHDAGGHTLLAVEAPSGKKAGDARCIRITILFFNDLHGNLAPFKVTTADGSSEYIGGIAGMATLVKEIRAQNTRQGIRTFLLVAGDVLQGTPMSTLFKGKPDIEIFNKMGVDAMTVGNHEFDFGLDNFLALKQAARFKIISSNIIWKDTKKPLNDATAAFPLSGNAVLTVIGATTTELLTTTAPGNVEKLEVLDPVATVAGKVGPAARKGPVILLSHSRFRTDAAIARANPRLTAIIGGHDQILFDPVKYASGVPVFQAFEKGRYLGRLDISFDPGARKAAITGSRYIPVTAGTAPDPEIAKIVADYDARLGAMYKRVIGESMTAMDGERGRIRYEETNLGNFVTDVMRACTGSDIALLNAGSLRAGLDRGPVTIEGIFRVMPYPNEIIAVTMTGAGIMEALARSVRGAREDEDGGFLHVSGISFTIRERKPADVLIGGAPLERGKNYTVTITDFMHTGGDGYTMFIDKPATKTGLPLRELLVDTVRKRGRIDASVEGRIKREE